MKITQPIRNQRMLFLIKNVLILKKLFHNIIENSFFLQKFVLITSQSLHLKDSFGNKAMFKSMFNIGKSPTSTLGVVSTTTKLNKNKDKLTKGLFDYFLYVNTWLPTSRIQPHHSFRVFYMYNSYLNVGCFNVKKVFVL